MRAVLEAEGLCAPAEKNLREVVRVGVGWPLCPLPEEGPIDPCKHPLLRTEGLLWNGSQDGRQIWDVLFGQPHCARKIHTAAQRMRE